MLPLCCRFGMPRRNSSRYWFSDRQGTDPRTSIRTTVSIWINLCFGALTLEWQHSFGGRDGDNTRCAELLTLRRLGWRNPGGPELPLLASSKWKRFWYRHGREEDQKAIIRLVNSFTNSADKRRATHVV